MAGWNKAGVALPECLLVPLYIGGAMPLGTLWIVSPSKGHFDSGHARIMTELAAFAGIALRMVSTEERLRQAFETQEQLTAEQETLTEEMGHRVKNLFAIVGGMIRCQRPCRHHSAGHVGDTIRPAARARRRACGGPPHFRRQEEYQSGSRTEQNHSDDPASAQRGRPVRVRTIQHRGDADPIGANRATNGFALVLHELATNAAKYGGLKADAGSVQVSWRREGDQLVLTWQERGGTAIDGEPAQNKASAPCCQRTQSSGNWAAHFATTGSQPAWWSRCPFQWKTCGTERGNSTFLGAATIH